MAGQPGSNSGPQRRWRGQHQRRNLCGVQLRQAATARARLDVRAKVGFEDPPVAGWRTEVQLITARGAKLLRKPLVAEVPIAHEFWAVRAFGFGGHVARCAVAVPRAKPWSAETPTLYRLVVSLVDSEGVVGAVREVLEAEALLEIDYVKLVDPTTLQPVDEVTGEAYLLLAVRVGNTRLIDNVMLRRAAR